MMKSLVFGVFTILIASCHADCDAGWESIGTRCFFFDNSKVSNQEARNLCSTFREGADLATLEDSNAHRDIYEYIRKFGLEGSFWLGGGDASFEGEFVWLDGSRIKLGSPLWALENALIGFDQEPLGGTVENCIVLDGNRWWYLDDRDCFNANHPLCMY